MSYGFVGKLIPAPKREEQPNVSFHGPTLLFPHIERDTRYTLYQTTGSTTSSRENETTMARILHSLLLSLFMVLLAVAPSINAADEDLSTPDVVVSGKIITCSG